MAKPTKSAPVSVPEPVTENGTPVMVKKLSINKIFGAVLKIGEEVQLTGTVSKVTTENSQYGDYSKYQGMFFAKHNGVTVCATILYLPEIGEGILDAAIAQADGKPVDFHFAVTRIEDKASKTGYAWGIIPKGETADASKRYLALLG